MAEEAAAAAAAEEAAAVVGLGAVAGEEGMHLALSMERLGQDQR
jgi:hypothetical protein